MQKKYFDLPLSLIECRKFTFHVKGALPVSGGRKTPSSPEIRNWAEKPI